MRAALALLVKASSTGGGVYDSKAEKERAGVCVTLENELKFPWSARIEELASALKERHSTGVKFEEVQAANRRVALREIRKAVLRRVTPAASPAHLKMREVLNVFKDSTVQRDKDAFLCSCGSTAVLASVTRVLSKSNDPQTAKEFQYVRELWVEAFQCSFGEEPGFAFKKESRNMTGGERANGWHWKGVTWKTNGKPHTRCTHALDAPATSLSPACFGRWHADAGSI